jgi:hypothetical protein
LGIEWLVYLWAGRSSCAPRVSQNVGRPGPAAQQWVGLRSGEAWPSVDGAEGGGIG